MKILMVGWYKPQIRGGAFVVQELAARLKTAHKIFVINMEDVANPGRFGHWQDDRIDIYQERMYLPSRFTNLQTLFQTTKRALILRKAVEVYHTHGVFFSGIGLLDKSKPLILHVHGYASLEPIASGKIKPNSINFKFLRWMEKKAVKRADVIITVGSKLRTWLIEELNAEESKVFVINNGVDTCKFKPGLKLKYDEFKFFPNERFIIFVKAFTEQSGLRYLIQAFSIIHEIHPDVKLIAIGGGPLKSEIENLLKSKNLLEAVELIDRIPHEMIPDYLNASKVFVLPSIDIWGAEETFGLSLLEAMSCGKPVITTNIGGPKEILNQGHKIMGDRIGILVPPRDVEALANAINYLLKNPEKAEEMGLRGREFSTKQYSWDNIVHNIENVYKYALKRRLRT